MEPMALVTLVVWVSVVFFVGWCAMLSLAEIFRHTWNWVDDHSRPITRNPLMSWVQRLFFRDGDASDIWLGVVLVTLWPLYVMVLSLFFAAKGVRAVRRWYKQRQATAVQA